MTVPETPFRPAPRIDAADVAVVVPTMLRPSLVDAVRSIYAQDLGARIQVLVGLDRLAGAPEAIDRLRAECPSHVTLTVVDPGYSLNRAHGGLYDTWHGGPLRAALTYLAHARFVGYLDDDNWFAPDHLSSLRRAVEGVGWAYSLRHVVAPDGTMLGVDRWLSIGPDARFSPIEVTEFADTSTLLVDKLRCHDAVGAWMKVDRIAQAMEDRIFSRALQRLQPGRGTGRATVYYTTRHEKEGIVRAARRDRPPTRRPKMPLREAVRRLPTVARLSGASVPGTVVSGADWPADDPLFARLIRQVRPATVLAVGDARATGALAIARALAAIGGEPMVVAIDTWHPRLIELLNAEDPAGLQWHGARVPALDRFLAAARLHGVDWIATPLAQPPGVAARYLQGSGVTVDMAVVDATESDEETGRLLHDYWPLLRPQGVLAGRLLARVGVNHRRPVEHFAAAIETEPLFRDHPDGGEVFAFRCPGWPAADAAEAAG